MTNIIKRPKLLITAHALSGKDTVNDIFVKLTGLTFKGSSEILLEEVIYPVLKEKYNYTTPKECFKDRRSSNEMRAEWFNLLCKYNEHDKARLGKLIFSQVDIYVGLRNVEELVEMRKQGVVDYVVWIDSSSRVPPEPKTSMTITPEDCDYILDNNGPEECIINEVQKLIEHLKNIGLLNRM